MSDIQPHEEFLELCAAAISGHLAPEEEKKLQQHLAACPLCREAMQQYEAIVGEAIPKFAARQTPKHLEPGPGWSPERAEEALFERIERNEESGRHQRKDRTETEQPHVTPSAFAFRSEATWRSVWILYAAGILLSIALGISAYWVGIHHGVTTATHVATPSETRKQLALEEELSDVGHEREIARAQIEQRDRSLADLNRELVRVSTELKQAKAAQDELEHELSAGNVGKQDVMQQRAELAGRLEAAAASAQALQKKLDAVQQESLQDAARAKALDAKVNDLTQQLHDRNAILDQQQELLAHDRDIRELMGARDLYIAEVYDIARTGATKKPYGRVFYTKGKSLIFYGYDLDQQAGMKNAETFQAWGRRGPDRQQALNLGIFYVDNGAKKRWVLKFDDPKTLAQIDAVFVTVEPNGGSQKPSGQPLLFTYLRVDPNHP